MHSLVAAVGNNSNSNYRQQGQHSDKNSVDSRILVAVELELAVSTDRWLKLQSLVVIQVYSDSYQEHCIDHTVEDTAAAADCKLDNNYLEVYQ